MSTKHFKSWIFEDAPEWLGVSIAIQVCVVQPLSKDDAFTHSQKSQFVKRKNAGWLLICH
jgi:hypothetical protein